GEVQSEHLMQIMDHDWEESLVPAREAIVRVGSAEAVRAAVRAVGEQVEENPVVLLRWRGCLDAAAVADDPWHGSAQPELPPIARRPPQSVPQRFGASGIPAGGNDLVEVLVRVYGTFD